jgi:hypothetical protein
MLMEERKGWALLSNHGGEVVCKVSSGMPWASSESPVRVQYSPETVNAGPFDDRLPRRLFFEEWTHTLGGLQVPLANLKAASSMVNFEMPWLMIEENVRVQDLHTGHDLSCRVMANTADCMV